jgi:hypothetical protein
MMRRETTPEVQHVSFSDALTSTHTASHIINEEMLQHAEEYEE